MIVLRILYEVTLAHWLLKTKEFGEVMQIYKNMRHKKLSHPVSDEKIAKILSRIDKVCFWFWGDAECLHRSIVGYKMLNRLGKPVDLVIGVRKFPFGSHAWLEFNNHIINDSNELKRTYFEINRIKGGIIG